MTFKPVPFSSHGPVIWVNEIDGIIKLTGTFEDNTPARNCITEALKYAAQDHGIWARGHWLIDAQDAQLAPQIITAWGSAAQSHLPEYDLTYLDSDLTRSLFLDSGYRHHRSKFLQG